MLRSGKQPWWTKIVPRSSITVKNVVVFWLVLITGFFSWLHTMEKCSMGNNLLPLLVYSTSLLEQNQIVYWLDYGTLLGAYRDRGIIPHEFDIDMGIKEGSCESVLGLKALAKEEKGWFIYGMDEKIPAKVSHMPWSMDDGFLKMPCARIYDENHKYYVDVYWYRPVPPMKQEEQKVCLPKGYTYGEELLYCNQEGYTCELPGGCKPERELFPLNNWDILGHTFKVPHNPGALLDEMYPGWQIPRAKGYKHVCAFAPKAALSHFLFGVTLIGVFISWAITKWDIEAKLCPRQNPNWLMVDGAPYRWR